MHFYFIRHGQTDANHQRILQGGSIDLPLNATGKSQAQELIPKVKRLNFLDIYVSPLKRAFETAAICLPEYENRFQLEPSIKEWSLGEWEGQPGEQFMDLFLGNGEPQLGESRRTFYSRVEGFLQTAISKQAPYMMVAHGGVWMVVQDYLGLERFRIKNGELIELKQNSAGWVQRVI